MLSKDEGWPQALTRSILRDASQSKSAVADFDPSLTIVVGQARLRCDAPQDEAGGWSLPQPVSSRRRRTGEGRGLHAQLIEIRIVLCGNIVVCAHLRTTSLHR